MEFGNANTNGYFDELTNYRYNIFTGATSNYLSKNPTKAGALNNAMTDGHTAILPNSNNRALIIDAKNKIFLQSYDTLILSVDKLTGQIEKLWTGYSVTTLKHINDFLSFVGVGLSFNKKAWKEFNGR